MHAKIYTATTQGIAAALIDVEADLSYGTMNFHIVGLPDKAIKESRERIKAAFKNSGLEFPEWVLTINLAPAHLKKQDTLFDVPMAVAILQAARLLKLQADFIQTTVFLGELSLDGTIRSVAGVLPLADGIAKLGKTRIVVPYDNREEAALIDGIQVIGVKSLTELVSWLRGEVTLAPATSQLDVLLVSAQKYEEDFSEVKGQRLAKRALQVAATGWHNILFIGSPGGGKTMLAKRLPTILPTLSFDDVLQTTKIYSIAGQLGAQGLVWKRPFRAPHHTISQAGLVGGGSHPQPGEISLAHHGVLFLDELTEFNRATLEVLRQPLEDKKVLIARAQCSVEFPAAFLLVAALNPCPCGFFGDALKKCQCDPKAISRYLSKLSGPFLDRIDIHVRVESVKYDDLKAENNQETSSSASMREKVVRARLFAAQRQGDMLNAHIGSADLEKLCPLTPKAEALVKTMYERLGLSMRSYHRIIRVARTLADFDESNQLDDVHVREAFLMRCFDKQ